MQKLTLLLASSALILSVISLVRREEEIRKDKEIIDLFQRVMTEVEFSKIVDHFKGESDG